MQVEVGNIVEGKVTGITHFGAFIAMDGGQTGMVHISEISNAYVKEIGDYISEDQEVKVKVLSIAADGKISLSMKQCEEPPAPGQERPPARASRPASPQNRGGNSDPRGGGGRPPMRRGQSKGIGWQPKRAESTDGLTFEDMMTKFKQVSNDRIGELKRANDPRRSRRGGGAPK